jgi:hypothetical protein
MSTSNEITEREAFEVAADGLHIPRNSNVAWKLWQAARASLPQQGEVVAWLYKTPMRDGTIFCGATTERLTIGIGVTPDSKEFPLRIANLSTPAPAIDTSGERVDSVKPWQERMEAHYAGDSVQCLPTVAFMQAEIDDWRELLRDAQEVVPSAVEVCTWKLDGWDEGIWQSSCGEAWSFIDGGPVENRVRFCHGCGKPVAAMQPTTEED